MWNIRSKVCALKDGATGCVDRVDRVVFRRNINDVMRATSDCEMLGVISWKRRASRCKNLANRLDKLIFRDGDLGFGAKFQIIRAVFC
jgi:hypothetical protein